MIEEINNNDEFEKSDVETETFEAIEKLKNPQHCNDGGIVNLDGLNEKEMSDPTVQAMIKRSRHNNLSIFIISQDYYEFSNRTNRANGNIYHIFKPNIFRDVPNLYQDKASMDISINEFKYQTYTCWNEKYQP